MGKARDAESCGGDVPCSIGRASCYWGGKIELRLRIWVGI